MKLPPIVRKLRKLSYYQITFTLFIIAMLAPVSQAYMTGSSISNFNANRDSRTNDNLITTITISDSSIKNDVRPEEIGSAYVPINQSTETSNQLTAKDTLSVYDSGAINLTNFDDTGVINNSYTINNIGDYTNESLSYGITEIKSLVDNYTIEDDTDGFEKLENPGYYSLAQAFNVEWEYALFYGSNMYLTYDAGGGSTLGEYELELFLVNSSGVDPDMTAILSNCTGNSFKQGNTYADVAGFQYFDFDDVQLTKGTYYIVANLSVANSTGALKRFQWGRNSVGVDNGRTVSRHTLFPGSWSAAFEFDFSLINKLLPCDSNNNSIIFSGPQQIGIQDNEQDILTLTSIINGSGIHVLSSNTSVQITYNNSYTFTKLYSGNEVYAQLSASNSSFWSYDVLWDINWTTTSIDISPYSNLNRTQFIQTPTDWNSVFTFYYNDTNTLTGNWESNGYLLLLNTNTSAGNWKLSTSSPNYVNSLTLSDDMSQTERYFLGYWIGDVSDSYGYGGSNITAEAIVQTDGAAIPTNETTGSLNYTLYDIDGLIIPIKSSLPANLIYTDSSSYTLGGILNSSAGYYQSTITFDPSASGSDLAGFWTAAVFWQNGTEAGYYSLRIVVQSQTAFEYEWETEPGSNIWTTADISRKGLDSINISTYYYNISEPYLSGQRNVMPDAVVWYDFHNGTWSDSGYLTQTDEFFGLVYNLGVGVDVGVYTFDFVATGAFIENLTASFDVTVFYELDFDPIVSSFNQTTYTDNATYYFALKDVTADTNLSAYPDDLIVQITNTSNTFNLTSAVDYLFTYQAISELWELELRTDTKNLDIGLYDVSVAVSINNYKANYSSAYVSDTFTLDIIAAQTSINMLSADSSIYLIHDATFTFNYVDIDHSVNLIGASVSVSFNVTGIDYNSYRIGTTFYVVITDNNETVSGIEVYLDISKDNYESISSYHLGDVEVLTITTGLTEETAYTPANGLIGYEVSVVVQFNDTIHTETLDEIYTISLLINASEYTLVSNVSLGNGLHNITFIVTDYSIQNLEWLNITIIVGKTGYYDASVSIYLQIISIETDSQLLDALTMTDVTIDYNGIVTYEIMYWDNITGVNITSPIIDVTGNLTFVFNYLYGDNITSIEISDILTLGYFELTITISKPGYFTQIIVISITVEEIDTITETADHEETYNETLYADETVNVAILYADNSTLLTVTPANITWVFYGDNITLNINDYFDIANSTFGDYYIINFDPIDSVTIGGTFYIQITFSSYGYETRVFYVKLVFYPPVTYDIAVEIVGTVQQLNTIQFKISLENFTSADLQALSSVDIRYAPSPVGDFVTIEYTFVFANGTRVTYSIQVEIGSDYTGLSEEIFIPWMVGQIFYTVTYTPTDGVVLESKSLTNNPALLPISPDFATLLTYLFQEFTVYMIIGLALIAILFIPLTVYFAIIRPKKQRRSAKKKRYLDKISKILTSVLSLRKVIVVHNETGLPIYEWDLGETMTVDSSLVSGFLQAVSGMGGEISGGKAQAVRKIDYGQFCVSSSSTENLTTYLFSTGDISVDVEEGLTSFITWFTKKFQGTLDGQWDGVTDVFEQASRVIIDRLSEDIFIWTLHPLSVNPVKEKDVAKLDSFSQKLYKFIKDYKEVTISVSLEYFNKSPIEETLSKLFELVDNTFLLRKRLR